MTAPPPAARDAGGDHNTMAHACAAMIAFCSLLATVSVSLDLTPDANRGWVMLLSVGALPSALIVWRWPALATPRLIAWVVMPVMITQVSLGIALCGDPSNPASAFYVLPILFSTYYFTRAVAITHLVLFAAMYAAALSVNAGPAEAVDRWAFCIGTAMVAGGVVAHLRARLERQANSDWLTGVSNRRGFDSRVDGLRGKRYGLLLLDIDHFKRLNDTAGHTAGDAALRDVADALVAVAGRENVGRVGGDEFAALFPGLNEVEVGLRAIDVRTLVAESGTAPTISLGVAAAPRHANDGPALIKAADDALYAAKRGGRDRTVIAAG